MKHLYKDLYLPFVFFSQNGKLDSSVFYRAQTGKGVPLCNCTCVICVINASALFHCVQTDLDASKAAADGGPAPSCSVAGAPAHRENSLTMM